jgi:hypothetical protein
MRIKLVPAVGNLKLQQALSHTYVRDIVNFILTHDNLLPDVAEILQTCVQKDPPDLAVKLQAIHTIYAYIDDEGNVVLSANIAKLIQTLENFYRQPKEKIEDQRGAIVELLACKLVCSRYQDDTNCANSRRFVDEQRRNITIQEVDVAVLSDASKQLEAYECKMRVNKLEIHDCNELTYLVNEALKYGYRANVGVISFDPSPRIRRKLKQLHADPCINSYGIDNLMTLRNFPFN